jgi:hypothetical protein
MDVMMTRCIFSRVAFFGLIFPMREATNSRGLDQLRYQDS